MQPESSQDAPGNAIVNVALDANAMEGTEGGVTTPETVPIRAEMILTFFAAILPLLATTTVATTLLFASREEQNCWAG